MLASRPNCCTTASDVTDQQETCAGSTVVKLARPVSLMLYQARARSLHSHTDARLNRSGQQSSTAASADVTHGSVLDQEQAGLADDGVSRHECRPRHDAET